MHCMFVWIFVVICKCCHFKKKKRNTEQIFFFSMIFMLSACPEHKLSYLYVTDAVVLWKNKITQARKRGIGNSIGSHELLGVQDSYEVV